MVIMSRKITGGRSVAKINSESISADLGGVCFRGLWRGTEDGFAGCGGVPGIFDPGGTGVQTDLGRWERKVLSRTRGADAGISSGKVQIVAKSNAVESDFTNATEIEAAHQAANNLNYAVVPVAY